MRRAAFACAITLAVGFAPVVGAAFADEDDESPATSPAQTDARARFADGNRKYAMGDYAGAEESFKAAIQLDPDLPGPYRNLGLVYVAAHRCEDAIARFQAYLKLRPGSKHSGRIESEIDKCKLGLGRSATSTAPSTELALVSISASEGGKAIDGAVVRIDGLIRGGAPLDLQITPGHHTVRVERIGYDPGEAEIEVRANATHEINVEMARQLANGATAPASRAHPSRRPIAWAMVALSAVGFAVGGTFGILESDNWRTATDLERPTVARADLAAYRDRGTLYSALAYTGLAVGVAAIGVAAVLFIFDSQRGEAHGEPELARRGRFLLAPTVGSSGGGVAAVGAW